MSENNLPETNHGTKTTIGPNWLDHPEWGFSTRQIHAGFSGDPLTGAQTTPIYATNAFHFPSVESAADRFALKELGPIYSRLGNPTNDFLEQRIANLEGGVGALVTASGQAAVALALFTLARQGTNIVASPSVYGGTANLLAHTLERCGIETRFVSDARDLEQWRSLTDANTVAYYGELVPNPQGDIFDIQPVAKLGHSLGIPLVIDNTVPTPYLCRPIEWGADIVVHSATKYLGGHASAMLGAIVDSGRFDYASELAAPRFPGFNEPDASYHGVVYARDLNQPQLGGNLSFILKARVEGQRDFGFAASPFAVFIVGLGVDTLSLRMERHVENAQAVAEFLAHEAAATGSPVTAVRYAGLPESPYYELGRKYLPNGVGALLNFDVAGGFAAGRAFIEALQLHANVANMGDIRSLAVHPASTTHSQLTPAELAAQGICAGTIRLSVGLEDKADIIADLQRGIAAAREVNHDDR